MLLLFKFLLLGVDFFCKLHYFFKIFFSFFGICKYSLDFFFFFCFCVENKILALLRQIFISRRFMGFIAPGGKHASPSFLQRKKNKENLLKQLRIQAGVSYYYVKFLREKKYNYKSKTSQSQLEGRVSMKYAISILISRLEDNYLSWNQQDDE